MYENFINYENINNIEYNEKYFIILIIIILIIALYEHNYYKYIQTKTIVILFTLITIVFMKKINLKF